MNPPLLWRAAKERRVDDVRQLLGLHRNPEEKAGPKQTTALHEAILSSSRDCVVMLLDHHANINCRDDIGETPLHYAITEHNTPLAVLLLERNADVAVASHDGTTPLHSAVSCKHDEILTRLLQHGASTTLTDTGDLSPIHIAILRGDYAVVELLLDNCTELGFRDNRWHTIVHWATIIASECNPTIDMPGASNALHILKLVVNRCNLLSDRDKKGQTALYKAAACPMGNLHTVEYLFHQGSGYVTDLNGRTPLYAAASQGRLKIVEFLLGKGVHVSTPDIAGTTPLIMAALEGRQFVVCALLHHGAAVSLQNRLGLSALHAAVEGGHEDVVRLLIQHGADVNPTTEPQKQTPLHYAARKGNSVIAHILLRRGADPNAHSSDGITPLEFAVHFGHRRTEDVIKANIIYRQRCEAFGMGQLNRNGQRSRVHDLTPEIMKKVIREVRKH